MTQITIPGAESAKTHAAIIAEAIGYVSHNWHVFPVHSVTTQGHCTCVNSSCSRSGKHPATASGFKDATIDSQKIKDLWGQNTPYNIGIATGEVSGIFVVDIDLNKGGPCPAPVTRLQQSPF